MSIYEKKLKYVSMPCGGGKTRLIISTINDNPQNNYIVVVPSVKLQNQYRNDIGYGLVINHETHDDLLEHITSELLLKNHQVLYITDKMFYRIKPQVLKNWYVYIDDCVEYFSYSTESINKADGSLPAMLYANLFDINGVSEDGSYVYAKLKQSASSDIIQYHRKRYEHLQYYHNIVINSSVFDNDDCKRIFIIGYYDLERYVSHGVNMIYMANDFENTLIYKKYCHLFEEYQHELVPNHTNNQRLTIKYFAKNNSLTGSRLKAEVEKGNSMMSIVGEYINANENGPVLWTCNEAYRQYWNVTGEYITPCQRGMNHLQHHTVAACLVSMKIDDAMAKHIEAVLGHTYGDIVHQNEYEAINQFVYRTNLRNYQSSTAITLYVFDEDQAYSIKGAAAYEYIDVGVDVVLNRVGRPASQLPPKVRDAARKWVRAGERTLEQMVKYVSKMAAKNGLDEGQRKLLLDKLIDERKGA